MTVHLLEQLETFDLSDLDNLDEQHIFCIVCNPNMPGLGVTVCGKQAFCRGVRITSELLDNACETCANNWEADCAGCGT